MSENIVLRGWQSNIIEMIHNHEDERGTERYQGVPEWVVNKDLSICVFMPRGSGHTFLASYIANEFRSILVYRDQKHYKELSNGLTNDGCETVSMYEIFYALYKPDVQQPSQELAEMTSRFSTDDVIVVDDALRVPQQVRDFIMSHAQGPVVFLGH